MRQGSLFSGIGGFDLAAEWMGWENVFYCEWNAFGKQVLKHYWPNAISYDDITKTDFSIHRGAIDIITGGFPCQPYSTAGKRLGKDDERHLWPEMLRAIREICPRWVVGENVRGLISWNGGLVFDEVQADLEAEGYEVIPFILPACAVNAPHRRDRVWFVAYSNGSGSEKSKLQFSNIPSGSIGDYKEVTPDASIQGQQEWLENYGWPNRSENRKRMDNRPKRFSCVRPTPNTSDIRLQQCWSARSGRPRPKDGDCNSIGSTPNPDGIERCEGRLHTSGQKKAERHLGTFNTWPDWRAWENFPTQPPVCGGNDGLPTQLDGITFPKWRNESIKAFGNAVVPQVVYQIFKAIDEYEKLHNETPEG